MFVMPITGLPVINRQQANGETAELYEEIIRKTRTPDVPNIFTAFGASAAALKMAWDFWYTTHANTTLPQALHAMIIFAIATQRNCKYCSAMYELNCRSLGVDEKTLNRLVHDLENLEPLRVREIIKFALKTANNPQNLEAEDYNKLRKQGTSDDEIMEIIVLSAAAVAYETVADAMKVEIDDVIVQSLEAQRGET